MEKLYDIQLINDLTKGSTEYIHNMLQIFLKNSPNDVSNLKQSAEKSDWQKVAFIAHKMKGYIDMLQISSIKQTIRDVEVNCKKGIDLDQIQPLVSSVVNTINQVSEQIRADYNL